MKRITYFIALFLMLAQLSFSQGEIDALNYSRNGLYGTARSISMGNAFGSLGGDITGVSINPAGIGVYRSSEIVGTFGYTNIRSEVGPNSNSTGDFNLHNLGFVGYFPIRSDVVPMINFGFTHNRQKSFNSKLYAAGEGDKDHRMLDYISDRTNQYNIAPGKLEWGEGKTDPFYNQPWLTVLAYNSWLIDPEEQADGSFRYNAIDTKGINPLHQIYSRQSGYIDQYDFSIGTTINDVLNLGLSINIADIYHHQNVELLEDFKDEGYTLGNEISTNGTGVGAKFGLIYRPIHALRVGLAYHTPMRYQFSERYSADLDVEMKSFITDPTYEDGMFFSPVYNNYYDITTPGKLVLSASSVGRNFLLSVDYELTDYSTMRLKMPSGNADRTAYDRDNSYIKSDFKAASSLRVGGEYRFTHQLSARLGYAWMESPYDDKFKKAGNAGVAGSNTVHRIEGDTQYITAGLGYRFSRSFYADFALVYETQTDDLYPFPNLYDAAGGLVIDAMPFELKRTSMRGLITLGYRF